MYLLASASSHAAWAAASTSCTSPSPPPRQNARSAAPSSEFNIKQRSHLPIRAGLHVELLLRGRHVVRGVERANLQVGASVVPAALHQVELGKEMLYFRCSRERELISRCEEEEEMC